MATSDLQRWVTSDIDFYELLGIQLETCSEAELRRAYRKTALKYHPDKVGANFDPEKYEIFQAAYEVLSNSEPKAQYDQYRQARIQRQRANELFEGKRKQMKEDLESREKIGMLNQLKRSWNNESKAEIQPELKKFTEEGRKRRAARASMMAESDMSSPVPVPPQENLTPSETKRSSIENEEDEVERLERRIKEAKDLKAKRKADKKARKSGVCTSFVDHLEDKELSFKNHEKNATPKNQVDILGGVKTYNISSCPSKLSLDPSIETPVRDDFAVTMARLKAAGKARLVSESSKQDSR